MSVRKLYRVSETMIMEESNGTTLKPIFQIVFLKQAYDNRVVLVFQLDSWCERLWSTSMPCDGEVLNSYIKIMTCFNLCSHYQVMSA